MTYDQQILLNGMREQIVLFCRKWMENRKRLYTAMLERDLISEWNSPEVDLGWAESPPTGETINSLRTAEEESARRVRGLLREYNTIKKVWS